MSPLKARAETAPLQPDFCTIQGVLSVVLIAEALALLLELSDREPGNQFWVDLGMRSLFILWVVLLSTAILCRLSGFFARWGAVRTGFIAFLVIQLVTVLVSAVVYHMVFTPVANGFDNGRELEFIFRNFCMSSIVALIILRYRHVQWLWKIQQRAEADARLDALQSRIRPHFLFNSLNTIASLTRSNPRLAEEMVQDLAELFRASLMTNRKFIHLADELELVRLYLNIESQRLGDRLRIDWQTASLPGDAKIPPLSLQPLVENAVKHGIEPSQTGGEIRLYGSFANGVLTICVLNTLPNEKQRHAENGNHIGLANVTDRLRACFPAQGRISTDVSEGTFQVTMTIPYINTDP